MKFHVRSLVMVGLSVITYGSVLGQSEPIRGTITDRQEGGPLEGVTVSIMGTALAVQSDAQGNYSIRLPSEQETVTLVYRLVGYNDEERQQVGSGSTVDVTMEPSNNVLEEVVAIGYATVKRRELTGAVSSISAEELRDVPTTSVLQALSGRLAGVHVTITEGSSDAEMKVRVRGGSSITQDNSPLYIVDGFQVGDISNIPMSDIETIDVLKDAASTAIYGAQGANGVVLVTTKSGVAGRTDISFNSYASVSNVYNLYEVLSPYEYVYYQRELDPSTASNNSFNSMYGAWDDLDIYKAKPGINWQDRLYGNMGVQQHYNVGLTGGEKTINYNLNYTRDDEDYVMLNSEFQRDYFSAKLNKQIGSKLKFDFNSRMSNTTITGPSISDGRKLREGVKYAPVRSLASLTEDALGGNEDITSAEALSSLNDPVLNVVNEYKKQHRF